MSHEVTNWTFEKFFLKKKPIDFTGYTTNVFKKCIQISHCAESILYQFACQRHQK